MANTREVMQRHHDFFVRLAEEGKLSDASREQYNLAMERERRGEVDSLVHDDDGEGVAERHSYR